MKQEIRTLALSGLLATGFCLQAKADVILSGPDSNAGSYSTAALAAAAEGTTVDSGGLTGIALWKFLGGASASNSTSPIYGAITTFTPPGMNAKNAILRYYLVGTNATGQHSVVSLGEINPSFGGTAPLQPFVAFKNTGGSLLAEPDLIVPGAPGRNLNNLTSLALLSVPAIPAGGSGVSAAVQLTGNVTNPGSYTLSRLPQNEFSPVTNASLGYTGVALWAFLNPSHSDSTDQIVITQATDGYEVVLSLAELDPSLGGNPDNLLPYAGTGFPGAGVARTAFPTDNQKGRWETNLNFVSVVDAPEPATLTVLGAALVVFGGVRKRLTRRERGAARVA